MIFESIIIVPFSEYQKFIEELKEKISDPKDVVYLAVCLSLKAEGIWTHDLHFKEQKKCEVYTNIDMIRLSSKSKSNSVKE